MGAVRGWTWCGKTPYGVYMHTDTETLAAKVEAARRREPQTPLRALSRMTGIPRTTLRRQLAGLVEFKVTDLMSVSRHLNLDMTDLLNPRENTAEVAAGIEAAARQMFLDSQAAAAALFPNEEYTYAVWGWVSESTRDGYRAKAARLAEVAA